MNKKINSVLKEVIQIAKPLDEELQGIDVALKEFLEKFRKSAKRLKINASVFVGGSFAKKTLVKKEKYDVDVFVRFEHKYKDKDISALAFKILKGMKMKEKIETVHGSRDYFKVAPASWFYFEIVPVMKVSNPKDAENITDLSFYHVNYVNKKAKNKKLLDDIILAKLFCHSNDVYGAESHIKGFSGYSLELLVLHYKGFVKFLNAMIKSKENQIVIDTEKHYKNKTRVFMDLNSSKLDSPIILIDPTYKQRNALATLSHDTFSRFKDAARLFLAEPSKETFERKEIDFKKIEKESKARGNEFLLLKIFTNRQEGAIAGSKLLKFYDFLTGEISRHFEIREKGFRYNNEQDADIYFSAKKKSSEVIKGPPQNLTEEVKNFKNKHSNTYIKKGHIYAEETLRADLKKFLKDWKNKNSKIIQDMYITDIQF